MEDLISKLPESIQRAIVLAGVPFDEYSSFLRGPAEAPPKIREALFSESSNMWSETGVDLGREFASAGDFQLATGADAFQCIERQVNLILERGLRAIFLGGDHSITFPLVKAIARFFGPVDILHFDAHPDIYDVFEGNPLSHACPFARIMESGLANRLVQVGIRTATAHQREQIRRFGVELIEMREFRDDLRIEFTRPVYISFDMDGLDPAFAPGVSHPEPGGLSARQAINLIQGIDAQVIGADVVEYNPRRDLNGVTAFTAAKLVKEIAAKMILNRPA